MCYDIPTTAGISLPADVYLSATSSFDNGDFSTCCEWKISPLCAWHHFVVNGSGHALCGHAELLNECRKCGSLCIHLLVVYKYLHKLNVFLMWLCEVQRRVCNETAFCQRLM